MDEMMELRKMLDAKGIEWVDEGDGFIERTHFVRGDGVLCSVVWGDSLTYGGDEGLLETMPPVHDDVDDDVEGYLTAQEIAAAWL